jgi:hypothetical protein
MSIADITEQHIDVLEDLAAAATAPARWLLETASDGGASPATSAAIRRA